MLVYSCRRKRKESAMQSSVLSVVIPAYNEENTIGDVLSKTISVMNRLKRSYEVILVDDGSTDNTKHVAAKHKATVLSNGRNRGKGYALKKGFQHAQGDIIITMDADGAHNPQEIPHLIHPLFNGVDIVAGSRFLGNGKYSTSRLNRVGNNLFNILIMILTGERVTDSQSGFRAFKRHVLREFTLESVGYEVETELTVKGLKNGFTFQEKPISCKKRTYNISRIRILFDGMKILKTIFISKFR